MIKYFMCAVAILCWPISSVAEIYKIKVVSLVYLSSKSNANVYDLYAVENSDTANIIQKGTGYTIQLLKKGKKIASRTFNYVKEEEPLGVYDRSVVKPNKEFIRSTMKVDFVINTNVRPDSAKLLQGKKVLKTVLVKY